jgi:hypothetical protein
LGTNILTGVETVTVGSVNKVLGVVTGVSLNQVNSWVVGRMYSDVQYGDVIVITNTTYIDPTSGIPTEVTQTDIVPLEGT